MVDFVKGLNIKTIKTKYGEILKCGINVGDLVSDENKINEGGWINFTIKKGKSGNWYAEVNENKESNNAQT